MAYTKDPNVQKWLDYFNNQIKAPGYKADPNAAKNYYAEQKRRQITRPTSTSPSTVVKNDNSSHHTWLDSIEHFGKGIWDFVSQKNAQTYNYGGIQVNKNTNKPVTSVDTKSFTGVDKVKQEFGNNLVVGTGDLIKGAGDTMRWLGSGNNDPTMKFIEQKVGNKISNWADTALIKPNEMNYDKKFGWHSLLDPEWYATSGARSLPFMLSMVAPELAGAKLFAGLGETAANATKLGTFGKTVVKKLVQGAGGAAFGAPLEAAFESANTFDQALKDGHDEATANHMANKTFLGNLAILAASGIPENALMFAPFLKGMHNPGTEQVVSSLVKRIGKGLGSALGSAAIEGGQEAGQQLVQDWAMNKKHDWNSIAEQGAMGAIMGGGMTAASHVLGDGHSQRAAQAQTEREDARVLRVLGGTHPTEWVRNDVINSLSDDAKASVNEYKDALEAQGHDQVTINKHVDEMLASTPEGLQKINDSADRLNKILYPAPAPTEQQANQEVQVQQQVQQQVAQAQQQTQQPTNVANPTEQAVPGTVQPQAQQGQTLSPQEQLDQLAQLNHEIANRNGQVDQIAGQVDQMQQQVMGQQPQVTGQQPQVTGQQPQVMGQQPQVTQEQPQAQPQAPTRLDNLMKKHEMWSARLDGLKQNARKNRPHIQRLQKELGKLSNEIELEKQNQLQVQSPVQTQPPGMEQQNQTEQATPTNLSVPQQTQAEQPTTQSQVQNVNGPTDEELQTILKDHTKDLHGQPFVNLPLSGNQFTLNNHNPALTKRALMDEWAARQNQQTQPDNAIPQREAATAPQDETTSQGTNDFQKGDRVKHTATGQTGTWMGEPHPKNGKDQNLHKVKLDNGKEVYWGTSKTSHADGVDHQAKKEEVTQEQTKPELSEKNKQHVKRIEEAWNDPKGRITFENMWPYGPDLVSETLHIVGVEFPYDMPMAEYHHKWMKEKGFTDKVKEDIQKPVLEKFDEKFAQQAAEAPVEDNPQNNDFKPLEGFKSVKGKKPIQDFTSKDLWSAHFYAHEQGRNLENHDPKKADLVHDSEKFRLMALEKQKEEAAKMTDDEILNKAAWDMGHSFEGGKDVLNFLLSEGRTEDAKKYYFDHNGTGGSHGGVMGYDTFGKKVKVSSKDGRKFEVSTQSQWLRYVKVWKEKKLPPAPVVKGTLDGKPINAVMQDTPSMYGPYTPKVFEYEGTGKWAGVVKHRDPKTDMWYVDNKYNFDFNGNKPETRDASASWKPHDQSKAGDKPSQSTTDTTNDYSEEDISPEDVGPKPSKDSDSYQIYKNGDYIRFKDRNGTIHSGMVAGHGWDGGKGKGTQRPAETILVNVELDNWKSEKVHFHPANDELLQHEKAYYRDATFKGESVQARMAVGPEFAPDTVSHYIVERKIEGKKKPKKETISTKIVKGDDGLFHNKEPFQFNDAKTSVGARESVQQPSPSNVKKNAELEVTNNQVRLTVNNSIVLPETITKRMEEAKFKYAASKGYYYTNRTPERESTAKLILSLANYQINEQALNNLVETGREYAKDKDGILSIVPRRIVFVSGHVFLIQGEVDKATEIEYSPLTMNAIRTEKKHGIRYNPAEALLIVEDFSGTADDVEKRIREALTFKEWKKPQTESKPAPTEAPKAPETPKFKNNPYKNGDEVRYENENWSVVKVTSDDEVIIYMNRGGKDEMLAVPIEDIKPWNPGARTPIEQPTAKPTTDTVIFKKGERVQWKDGKGKVTQGTVERFVDMQNSYVVKTDKGETFGIDASKIEPIGQQTEQPTEKPTAKPLDVIDPSREFPKVTYKVLKTGIKATFIPIPHMYTTEKELTFPFGKDSKGIQEYLRLPKDVSVSDIHDWLNIDFAQEGVTGPELIATFDMMNGKAVQEKVPPKENTDTKYEYPYFSTTGKADEIKALNAAKPKNVLIAFNHFWNQKWDSDLYSKLLSKLSYKPEQVILDSGAITFFNQKQDIGIEDLIDHYSLSEETLDEVASVIDHEVGTSDWEIVGEMTPIFRYIKHLQKGSYNYAFNLDTIGYNDDSYLVFQLLNKLFPGKIIPVFSAIEFDNGKAIPTKDFSYLEKYAEMTDYIGIGGLAIDQIKDQRNLRVDIINTITEKFPDKKFHVLGTLDKRVIDQTKGIFSSDGTAWIDRHGLWIKNGKTGKAEQSADNIKRMEDILAPKTPSKKDEITQKYDAKREDRQNSRSKRMAEKARQRLNDKYKKGDITLNALPFDDIFNYAIIGYDWLADKALDKAEFTEKLVAEFGESIRKWSSGVYGVAQDMLEKQDDRQWWEEMLVDAYPDGSVTVADLGFDGVVPSNEQAGPTNEKQSVGGTGQWLEKPQQRSHVNFGFTPEEHLFWESTADHQKPGLLKSLLLDGTDPRYAYDIYVKNMVAAGRQVEMDSKDFIESYKDATTFNIHALRKYNLGFGTGIAVDGNIFQVTMGLDKIVHVAYEPSSKRPSEDVPWEDFMQRYKNDEFAFGKHDKPVWAGSGSRSLSDFLSMLEQELQNGNSMNGVGDKNVSNSSDTGSVPQGKTADSVQGNDGQRQTETVSSPNGTKSNGADQQSNDGQPNESTHNGELHGEPTGDKPTAQDTPRNVDGGPLPIDHTITGEIYESGKVARFNNNIAAMQVLKTLKQEDRLATAEEKDVLAKYQGWGGLPEYFEKKHEKEYNELRQYVDDLFTEEEYQDMSGSTTTSFYTSHEMASEMYRLLQEAGFEGGRVLEPSVGTGMFIGSAPEQIKGKTKFVTVEKDRISHEITKYLYPNQVHWNSRFESKHFNDNSFDVVIGNVPFGNFGVYDANYRDKTVNKKPVKMAWVNSYIHNYFLVRSMDLLRPGGLGMLITSTNTLNSTDEVAQKTREYLYNHADMLDVVRLPNGAFDHAGTSVAADIIFFRKKVEGSERTGADIRDVVWYDDGRTASKNADHEKSALINEHYYKNPNFVIGDTEVARDRYGRNQLKYKLNDFTERFKKAINDIAKRFKGEYVPPIKDDPNLFDVANAVEAEWARNAKGAYDGAVHEREGKFYQFTLGKWVPFTVKKEHEKLVRSAIAVRDASMNLAKLEADKKKSTLELVPHRDKLNVLYDAFVKAHGNFNKKGVLTPIEKDDRAISALRALEVYNEKTKQWDKKEVFSKRMKFPDINVDVKGDIHQAIAISLAARGELDLFLISDLMKKSLEDTTKQLENENLVYFDPAKADYVTTDEYLSGNIYNKLQYVQGKPEFMRNEQALQNVMPEQLTTDQVTEGIRFGQQWIPAQVYQDFLREVLKVHAPVVKYERNTASWSVGSDSKAWNRWGSHENQNTYGVQEDLLKRPTGAKSSGKWSGADIMEVLMNQKSLKASIVEERLPSYLKAEVEKEKLTNALQRKGEMLLQAFRNYIQNHPEYSKSMTELYNNKFNSIVLRNYDGELVYGSDGMLSKPIPGLNNVKYKLYKHQKDAAIRILQQQNTLLAHVVGAGKTLEMQVGIMEGRRLGIIRKPLLVVPSFMLEQHTREFQDAYPDAKIKVMATGTKKGDLAGYKISNEGKKDPGKLKSEKEKNRQLRYQSLADVMYGDYDVTIMTYEGFERMPVSPEFEQQFLQGEVDKLRRALEGTAERDFTVKEIEKAIERLIKRIQESKNTDIKDVAISFEELGFDALFVDEAHNYKNLMYSSKMGNIAGLSNSEAQRSLDMYLKTTWMNQSGNKTVFATGTPIANSVAEMFTMLRYLAPKELAEWGMEHFDGWAAQYGTTINSVELNTSGKFVERTRFSQFTNVPELMNVFKNVADVKMGDDLPYLKRPQVERETVSTPMSEKQKTYLEIMVKRATMVNGGIEPYKDNMLKLTGEGKKLALDYRIIDGQAPNETESKLNKVAEEVAKEYKATTKGNKASSNTYDENGNLIETFDNGTQLVFMDLGVPKADDKKSDDGADEESVDDAAVNSMYQNLKDRLIKLGVNPNHVAFVHDYNKPDQKKLLSEKFNKGEIRIIIGSTGKMGVGMNLQKRLTALHHADPTWRPADIEQREGRIIRQGNWNQSVKVKTYVTESSFDALMWKTLEGKAKFIAQVMSGNTKIRSMDEIAEQIMSYTEITATATGNEAMQKLITVEKDLRKLRDEEGEHSKEQARYKRQLDTYPEKIAKSKRRLETIQEAEKVGTNIDGSNFVAEMDGITYSEKIQEEKNQAEMKKPKDQRKDVPGARSTFREHLFKKLAKLFNDKITKTGSTKLATVGGLDLVLDVYQSGRGIDGQPIYGRELYLQHTGSNGTTIYVASDNLSQSIGNESQGFLQKLANGLRTLSTGSFSKTEEAGITNDEKALEEAKKKGNVPFAELAKLNNLLQEVADLRDKARAYELTNSFDTVFQKGGELYYVNGVEYDEVPSKNKKKQKEDKPDFVTSVNVTKIDDIRQETYQDENGEPHTINVFIGGRTENMRDVQFIRGFTRQESTQGISEGTYQQRLREIERLKRENAGRAAEEERLKAEMEQMAQQEQPTATATATATETQSSTPKSNEPTSQPQADTSVRPDKHTRKIRGFGMASVQKHTVDGKTVWSVFYQTKDKWVPYASFMKANGGTYQKKGEGPAELNSKFVFDHYPEKVFVSDNADGPKGFSIGADKMEHNIGPKTAKAVSDKLARALKTVLRSGGVNKRNALATFEPHKYAGNIKNKWLHNIRVSAHELGHAFEEKGFNGNEDELLQVGEKFYPAWDEIKKHAVKLSEGRAELFTLYVLDPEKAAELAPKSVGEIEEIIGYDPALSKAMQEIHREVGAERTKGIYEQGIGSIKMPSEKRQSKNIGDEYAMDGIGNNLTKRQEKRLEKNGELNKLDEAGAVTRGYLRRKVAQIIDFKVPWKDFDLARKTDAKSMVKMLGVTGNAEMLARNSFTGWAMDQRGRYIINYEKLDDVPEFLQPLLGKLLEMNPNNISKKEKKNYELYGRYASAYQEGISKGLTPDRAKERAALQAVSARSLQEIAEDGMVYIAEQVKQNKVPASVIEEMKRIAENKDTKESSEFQVFTAIIQAYRAQERYSRKDAEGNKKFKEVYMSEEKANGIVEGSKVHYPDLENLVKEYTTNLNNIIMTKLVSAGVETQELRDTVEAQSNFYIPTYYAESNPHGNNKDATERKAARKVVNKFSGRQATAVNWLEATAYKLLEVEQSIEFKQVLNEVESGIKEEGMGVFGEVLPQQRLPQYIDGAAIAKQVATIAKDTFGDTVIDLNALEDSIADSVFKRFFPTDMLKGKILMNYHEDPATPGKKVPVFIRLAPDLYDSLKSMKPIQVGAFLRGLSKLSRVTRHLNIMNPRYLWNAITRDLFGSAVQTNAEQTVASNFLTQYWRGMLLSAGKDPMLADQYMASGAFMSSQESILKSFARSGIAEGLLETKAKGWFKTTSGRFVHVFQYAWDKSDSVLQWQEQVARYGEWEAKAKELAADYGVDPKKIFDGREKLTVDEQGKFERILLELGYAASEVTTNFRTHGTNETIRKAITPISFLHGSLQGIYREGREMQTNPKRAFLRMSAVLAPMTLIAWAALQALDADDKDDITSEMRDKYWIFPVGNHYFFVAKPFGYTMILDHFERILDDSFGGPTARSWYEDFFSPEIHNFTLPLLPIWGQTMVDLYANKSYYGAPIVSDTNASKFSQIDSKSSKLAEWQAKAEMNTLGKLTKIFGGDPESMVISPDKFDYAFKQLFGSPGQIASNAVDDVSGKPRPINKTMSLPVTPKDQMASRLMNKFYNQSQSLEKQFQRDKDVGKAEKGKPPEKVKAYRQMTADLRDMRKLREDAQGRKDLSSSEKANVDKEIVKAMNDVSRNGNGAKANDLENLQKVLGWVQQYRNANK